MATRLTLLLITMLGLQSAAATTDSPATAPQSPVPEKSSDPQIDRKGVTVRSVPLAQRAPVVYESQTGRILFRANILGRDVWAMLDTGASHSLMHIELARAAGLDLAPQEKPAKTTRGELAVWRVSDVAILIPGQFEVRHPWLAVADLSALSNTGDRKIEFMLGRDFLRSSVLLVDPAKRTLQFAPSGAFKAPATAVKISLQNGEPQVEVRIGNEKVLVNIDTGFNGQLSLAPAAWARVLPKDVPTGSAMSMGAEGRTYATKSAVLPEIAIGSLSVTDVVVDESPALLGDGLLGMGILGKFRLALDIKMGVLWVGSSPPFRE